MQFHVLASYLRFSMTNLNDFFDMMVYCSEWLILVWSVLNFKVTGQRSESAISCLVSVFETAQPFSTKHGIMMPYSVLHTRDQGSDLNKTETVEGSEPHFSYLVIC